MFVISGIFVTYVFPLCGSEEMSGIRKLVILGWQEEASKTTLHLQGGPHQFF